MKSSADPIAAALQATVKHLDKVEVIYEDGKVVHVRLTENVQHRALYERITEIFKDLTGPGFYGKLLLRYKNGEQSDASILRHFKR